MTGNKPTDISKFCIAGINYKKTDAGVRGEFAINSDQYSKILGLAPGHGVHELFVLSTCNRTEIYGFAEEPDHLIDLLCTQTAGTGRDFRELTYVKKGGEAIEHLFNVGAGLDSQILGDYEIVGQLKQAVKFSRERGFIGSFLERLVNCVLQSSKTIKNQTELSSGTVSVSFAAIQYIKEKISSIADKKILLIGIGKIGRNTCRNLIDYLETKNITLINRTHEKARELAEEAGVSHASFDRLSEYIHASDIILVATNATEPTLLRSHLQDKGDKLIIDLSIPYNVELTARELPNISLVNVDELSRMKDETLQKREAEVPKARAIISGHIAEFMEWHDMRKHVPVLKAVKTKLNEIHSCPLFFYTPENNLPARPDAEEKIQRVINGMAFKMRQHNKRGCHYIEAINEFIGPGAN
ncbi:MAG: glutamyl-tRNA reductase [Puia sp.]|nr:glutamyl-tRNA reductase [Puia sp.]